jgi:hypothetical protein
MRSVPSGGDVAGDVIDGAPVKKVGRELRGGKRRGNARNKQHTHRVAPNDPRF